MANRGIIELDPVSIKRSCDGNQLCFLSKEQIGMVGDVFSLDFEGEMHHFKILDIWFTPKDFAKKFLWRLCGMSSADELDNIFKTLKLQDDMLFAHIYSTVSWTEFKSMVIK